MGRKQAEMEQGTFPEPNRRSMGGISFWWHSFNHVLFGITRQRPGLARSDSGGSMRE
jgi:hypothetical protein